MINAKNFIEFFERECNVVFIDQLTGKRALDIITKNKNKKITPIITLYINLIMIDFWSRRRVKMINKRKEHFLILSNSIKFNYIKFSFFHKYEKLQISLLYGFLTRYYNIYMTEDI